MHQWIKLTLSAIVPTSVPGPGWLAEALAAPAGIWLATSVTLAFAALARWMRGVSRSGALAGAVICFVLIVGAGLAAFITLVAVFLLTLGTTRLGYQRKQKLGTAEKSDGRKASQVLANLGVAAGCAIFFVATHRTAIFLLSFVAALAEAAADTVSSELGQAGNQNPRLITNWQEVPAGTDGGISVIGTAAGLAAAILISAVGWLTGLLPVRWMGACITAAMAGMLADSYLGAGFQRRGILNNDAVNFLGTLIAALAAAFIA